MRRARPPHCHPARSGDGRRRDPTPPDQAPARTVPSAAGHVAEGVRQGRVRPVCCAHVLQYAVVARVLGDDAYPWAALGATCRGAPSQWRARGRAPSRDCMPAGGTSVGLPGSTAAPAPTRACRSPPAACPVSARPPVNSRRHREGRAIQHRPGRRRGAPGATSRPTGPGRWVSWGQRGGAPVAPRGARGRAHRAPRHRPVSSRAGTRRGWTPHSRPGGPPRPSTPRSDTPSELRSR